MLKSLKYILLLFIVYFIWTKGSKLFETASPWDAFAQMPQFGDAISQYTIGSIFLVVIVVGAIFIERFFCRYLCPLGAVFAVTSKFRIFDILKKRDKCGNCRLCTNSCSMGIPMYKHDKIKSGECINCFKCIDACPRKNTKAEICGEHVSPMLATCVAIGGFTALYSGTNLVSKNITTTSISQNTQRKVSSNLETNKQNKKYKDGTYIGTGTGYRPGLQVSVTIKNGKIADIKIASNNETPRFAEQPFAVVPNEIVQAQSTEVDGVSGATRSSNGIKQAVEDALKQALQADNSTDNSNSQNNNSDLDKSTNKSTNNNNNNAIDNSSNINNSSNNSVTNKNSSSTNNQQQKYKDGIYTGTGRGYRPNLQVSVTIKNGKIADIQIASNNETPRFAEQPFAVVPNEIVQAQSTEVDGVSGATRSSNGIKQAVEDALSKAKI